jgi:hypothetical protein
MACAGLPAGVSLLKFSIRSGIRWGGAVTYLNQFSSHVFDSVRIAPPASKDGQRRGLWARPMFGAGKFRTRERRAKIQPSSRAVSSQQYSPSRSTVLTAQAFLALLSVDSDTASLPALAISTATGTALAASS